MAIGRNAVTYIGKQQDKETPAATVDKIPATSNTLNLQTQKGEKEAQTGSRFTTGEFVQAYNCGGDIGIEFTKETLPKVIPYAGLEEVNSPANFETVVDSNGTHTVDSIVVERAFGISAGDTLDVGSETAMTVDTVDYRTRTVTFTTSLSAAPTGGETVINNDKFAHRLELQEVLQAWATILKYFTDSGYYEEYKGCRVNSLALTIAKKAVLKGQLGILTLEGEQNSGTPSATLNDLSATDEDLMSYGTNIILGGDRLDGVVDEFNITNENNMDDDDRGLNDLFRDDLEAQKSNLTFDFQAKFEPSKYVDIKDKEMNNVEMPLDLHLDEGVAIEIPRVVISESDSPQDGPDKITMSVNGTVYGTTDGTPPMTFVIVDESDTQY